MAEYKRFVEFGIEENDRPFKDLRAGIVLGREGFVEEKIEGLIRDKSADRELPALKRLSRKASMEEVIKAVADHYALDPGDLTKRSRRCSTERKAAIYLSKVMTGGKNSFVGAHFGITPQAVTNILTEVENKREQSKGVRQEIDEIKCKL